MGPVSGTCPMAGYIGEAPLLTPDLAHRQCIIDSEDIFSKRLSPLLGHAVWHNYISSWGNFIPGPLYLWPCAEVFFRWLFRNLLIREEISKTLFPTLTWSTVLLTPHSPLCSLPAPESMKLLEPFVRVSLNIEKTAISVLILLVLNLCVLPWGKWNKGSHHFLCC